MEKNLRGQIKWYDPLKGYGYLNMCASDIDYFFHRNDLIDKDIEKSDLVTFDEVQGKKGIVAGNVRKVKYI
jgi:CspA family cold shock protein